MSIVTRIVRFFSVSEDPELVRAQARAFSRQVPMMYGILLISSIALASTHGNAPDLLRLYAPGLLALICVTRIATWWRSRRRDLTYLQARRLLNTTLLMAAPLGFAFAGWALALYPYGTELQQSHIAFYIGITSIGCIFCLTYLRGAATLVALSVVVPFTLFFVFTENGVFVSLAFNLILVVATLMSILLNNYRDFGDLIASRGQMVRKQRETQMLLDENRRLANLDPLTGLPNQRSFDRRLRQSLAHAEVNGSTIAVVRLDLDSFKTINDVFGRISGDQVLVEVTKRIKTQTPPGSFVARLAADNFGIILESAGDEEHLRWFGNVLTAAMRVSFNIAANTIHLSASAGLATSIPGDTDATVYDRADYATWVSKRETRGGAVVFTKEHGLELSTVRKMEHALRTADLDKEIHILFQPQFDISQNRTTGYEVLARWRSPTVGDISPCEFIPMAERMGIISKITQTVLRKALVVADKLPRSQRLAVNLSAHDLSSATAIEAIVALVSQSGKPCRIDFEITETAVMHDLAQATKGLLALLALGSRIALDDFGTGHSSLTHVQKLPLDKVKIDRSFVAEVTTDPTSRAIIKTTVDLCRNLGIACVFEGIETEQQLNALLALGGTVMQGYLFGRPMPEEMFDAYLARENSRRAEDERIALPA